MKKLIFLVFGLWIVSGMAQESKEPGINEFIFADADPLPVNLSDVMQAIGYPEEAVNENIQGDVVVRILIDEEGNYVKHSFIKEIHPSLTTVVDEHISELTFTPALQNGNPIKFWTNIRFPFKLVEAERDPREVAIEVLTEVITQDSTDYQAYLKRGIQYRDLNRLDEAITDFNTSLALNPGNKPKPVEPVPVETGRKKKKKKKKGEVAEPVPTVDTVAITYVFYAQYAKGTALSLKQAHQEAIDQMSKAIEMIADIPADPADSGLTQSFANVFMERGFAHSSLSQYDEALTDYKWVIDNAPSMACNVHQLMADIYLNQKDFESLITAYDNLITCQPNSPLLYYSRGYYKTETGDYEGAISDFEKMLESSRIVNLNIAANNRIGWAYMKLGKYDEAFAGIQKALDINVLNPQSYFYRGLVYEAQGDQANACKEAQKASNFGMEGSEEQALADIIARLECSDEGE